jgi:peptidyl-prolyl cis-trans isomerase SurA
MRVWRLIVALGAVLLAFSLPAGAQRLVLVDRIVAVVNKEVVTASELAERVALAERDMRRNGNTPPERELLEKQILERLILDKAQLQLARETGIRVDEIQLDRAIERIAENNKLTLAAFRRALESDGVSFERFRNEVREQIMLSRLREREVDDKIQVSDSEIDAYLAEKKDAPRDSEYNIAHILVRVPDQAGPERIEAARARAEKARGEALAGGDFAKLAAAYSDAPEALKGGELGWRSEDRMPELFVAALRPLKQGAVSEVLRSPAGFHVLKLLERRGSETGQQVEQTRARHILVRSGEQISEAEARRRLVDLRERVVTGGQDFGELAKLHSDDTSAGRGGDLDWIYPGDTVPEFERAMQQLKPGEVSQPVKSSFGWHLIQVLERRVAGESEERRRLEARSAIRARKSDDAYDDWLRQLRDTTYVDLRLEER